MDEYTAKFVKEKVTPNTVRYKEVTESAPVIKTIYVQSWWAGEAEELEITVRKIK